MSHFTRHTHRFYTLFTTAFLLIVSLAQTGITTAQTQNWVWEKGAGQFDAKLHCVGQNPVTGTIFACHYRGCLLYTSPSPRDLSTSRMPSSA